MVQSQPEFDWIQGYFGLILEKKPLYDLLQVQQLSPSIDIQH